MKFASFAAAAAIAITAGAAQAQDFDVEAGEKIFQRCMACHVVGENARNRVGPVLNGVVGREWGAVEDFKRYSKGREGTMMQIIEDSETHPVWDYATLDAYLTNPKDIISRGAMAFAGLRKEEDRVNVIAYLAQFDADGAIIDPAPVLAAAKGDGDAAEAPAEDAEAIEEPAEGEDTSS